MKFFENFQNRFNREPRRELDLNAPPKKGLALFFSVLWREFWELFKLNLVFILACIPVVTIPAAMTAISKVIVRMLMDKPGYTFGEFYSAFKAEWKRSTIAGLIYYPFVLISMFGPFFYSAQVESLLLFILSIFLFGAVLIVGFYLFPAIALFDIRLKDIFRNAALLTVLRMPYNILALLVVAALSLMAFMFLPASFPAVVLILFSLNSFITTFCAYTGFKRFVIDDSNPEDDPESQT